MIIDLANRVLPHLGVSVAPARSVRTDSSVDVLNDTNLTTTTTDGVAKALVELGMVGVIASETSVDALRDTLPVNDRVEIVPPSLAKGLEFDHVILVEPAAIIDDAARDAGVGAEGIGLRHRCVALTRAVSRLTLVHSQPIPSQLGAVGSGSAGSRGPAPGSDSVSS